jgi:Spy/CpxP family protein refolding chaperone
MTKNKILILVVAALLMTNIAMLVFFVNKSDHKGPGPKRNRETVMTDFVQKDLGFNQQQQQQFDTLNKLHREKIKQLMDSLRGKKEQALIQLAQNGFTDSAIAQSASQSVSGQTDMELLMLRHFKNIRNICTPAQQAKFDTTYYKLWHRKGEPEKK